MRSTSSVAMIRWLASSGRLVLGKKAWVRSLIQTEPCLTPTNPRMCTATPPSYQLAIYFFHIVDKSKPQKLKQFPSNVQARPTLLENSALDTTPRVFLELVVKYCWKCRGVLCLFIVWVTEEPLHCIGAQHNSVASAECSLQCSLQCSVDRWKHLSPTASNGSSVAMPSSIPAGEAMPCWCMTRTRSHVDDDPLSFRFPIFSTPKLGQSLYIRVVTTQATREAKQWQ